MHRTTQTNVRYLSLRPFWQSVTLKKSTILAHFSTADQFEARKQVLKGDGQRKEVTQKAQVPTWLWGKGRVYWINLTFSRKRLREFLGINQLNTKSRKPTHNTNTSICNKGTSFSGSQCAQLKECCFRFAYFFGLTR